MRSRFSTVDAIMRNVYTSPSREYLIRQMPDFYLVGEMHISDLALRKSESDERGFIAVITAELRSTLGEMCALTWAPTFPVHDEAGDA